MTTGSSSSTPPDPAPVATGRKRSPTQRRKGTPLNEQDWVDAAMKILVNENVRGIRIDTLCAKLGVTKGSFYWHFGARNDLLVAMLKTWRRKMTLNVIKSITLSGETARERLRILLALPRRKNSPANARIEMSIRDWARRVQMPKEAVQEVDLIRMDYFTRLFRDMGVDDTEAEKRAYITYCLMMGDSVLHQTLPGAHRDAFLDGAMELITYGAPDQGRAAALVPGEPDPDD